MTIFLFLLAYGIVGTAIGRALFVKRMANKTRFALGRNTNDWGQETGGIVGLDTQDLTSAQIYGIWSIFVWPFTLAIFLIQAPTAQEKAIRKDEEFREAQARIEKYYAEALEK